MKPRTKLQVKVFALSKNLSALTKEQEQWAFKNCLRHVGYRTKSNISCLDCGYVWEGPQNANYCKCPQCLVKLKIEDTRKKKLDQYSTVVLMDIVDGFQINRFFEICSYHKSGEKARQFIWEIVQQWFGPDEKLTIVGKTHAFGNGGFSGDMEIRANISNYWSSNKYDLYTDKIHPDSIFLPIYKRNGFSTSVENVQLYSFLNKLLLDSISETLIKAKQFSLLSARSGNKSDSVRRYWDSIKICIRNKYIVKYGSSYLDYLDMLREDGKDLHSPKYVCPVNFSRDHNRMVAKRTKALRIQQDERNRRNAEFNRIAAEKRKLTDAQDAIRYMEEKAPYFDLIFKSGKLTIKVLESVEAFKIESEALNHCVFSNRYYNFEDSLCFSATVDGVHMETIEVCISTLKIVQARGINNHASEFNKEIIDLVNKNMYQINKRRNQAKKQQHNLKADQIEAA